MPKGKPTARWVRFSEEQNALDYLEKVYESLTRVQRRPQEWKWIVVGLHGALYGFAICVLKGTNWEAVTEGPKRRLITFDAALRRCQSADFVGFYVDSKPLRLTPDQRDAIRFLKGVRNQIEHYVPKAWLIEAHGLAVSAIDALDVIHFLALESGNVRLDQSQHQRVEACTAKSKDLLHASQLYKDHSAAKKRLERSKRRKQT
jgi:hypothetical protein